jgi:small GTP-binding protein
MRNLKITYNTILLGNSGVGKTTIINKLLNIPTDGCIITVGVDFHKLENQPISLNIWDTAGQERFRQIISSYARTCVGALLVFDMTDRNSMNDLDKWVRLYRDARYQNDGYLLIVGNKSDMEDKISTTEIADYICYLQEKYGIQMTYTEASCYNNEGLSEVKDILLGALKQKWPIKRNGVYPLGIRINKTINHDTCVIS